MRYNLIKARQAAEITQKELGQLLNVSPQTISHLERGRSNGRVPLWDKLETILNTSQRELRQLSVNYSTTGPPVKAKYNDT